MTERGSATVLAAAMAGTLAVIALLVVAAVSPTIAVHRAGMAADLAAVSGAQAQWEGHDGCLWARRTVELNGAELADCRGEAMDIVVTARVGRAEATARAGPL